MGMRNLIIVLALVICAVAIIPEVSDAHRPDYPDEPAVLCYSYYDGGWKHIDTVYVMPDVAIGETNIPELTGSMHYWVRMDTGEVVTSSTTFASGTYMIRAYTTAPTPWGAESSSGSGGLNEAEMLAIILLVSQALLAGAFVYYVLKKK